MKTGESLYSVKISQLAEHIKSNLVLNDDFIIIYNINENKESLSFPFRLEAFVIGICLKGRLTLSVNLQDWVVSQNMCVLSMPGNIIGAHSLSDDFDGLLIAISVDYLRNINIDLQSIIPYYTTVRIYPYITVDCADILKLKQIYELISVTLSDDGCARKEEIVGGLFTALVFLCADQLDKQGLKVETLKNKSKQYYFVRFMELLVSDLRTSRKVEYYSDRLGVTPKYLSGLIKTVSGSSAAKWIDEYTIAEASMLLRFSDKTIQQIADEMNFPSQSFFSKYYKQHTGITPSQYRYTTTNYSVK